MKIHKEMFLFKTLSGEKLDISWTNEFHRERSIWAVEVKIIGDRELSLWEKLYLSLFKE